MGKNTWEIYDLWQDGRNTACLGKLQYFSDQYWQLPWPPDCCQYAHGHMHVKLQMRSCSQGQIHQQTAKHFSETSLVMFP